MQTDFYEQIQNLRNTGNPFAIATVVRAEKPISAKAGAKAIITEDGALSGWIGGSCAEPRTIKARGEEGIARWTGAIGAASLLKAANRMIGSTYGLH